jgi:hypothetical protein
VVLLDGLLIAGVILFANSLAPKFFDFPEGNRALAVVLFAEAVGLILAAAQALGWRSRDSFSETLVAGAGAGFLAGVLVTAAIVAAFYVPALGWGGLSVFLAFVPHWAFAAMLGAILSLLNKALLPKGAARSQANG